MASSQHNKASRLLPQVGTVPGSYAQGNAVEVRTNLTLLCSAAETHFNPDFARPANSTTGVPSSRRVEKRPNNDSPFMIT